MALRKKGWFLLFGLVAFHAAVIFLLSGDHFSAVGSILWERGHPDEYLTLPFALSRLWDLAIIPCIFLTYFLAESIGFEKETWGSSENEVVVYFVTCILTLITVMGYVLRGSNGVPAIDDFFLLLKLLGVGALVFWVVVLLVGNLVTATYSAFSWFFMNGLTLSFIFGIWYFLLLSVPSVILAFIVLLIDSAHLRCVIRKKILAFRKWWEERNSVERIIKNALSLKVTPSVKAMIVSVAEDMLKLKIEIDEKIGKVSEIRKNLDFCRDALATAEKFAAKKEVDAFVAESFEKIAKEYREQKQKLDVLLSDTLSSLDEKRKQFADGVKTLDLAAKKAEMYEAHDKLVEFSFDFQKEMRKMFKPSLNVEK